MARIAFYAPIKPPDHPIASGDRQIALLLMKALERGGHTVELASRHISYSKNSAAEVLASHQRDALAEADRLIADWSARPPENRPNLWLTYHPYCKAPDWLGPRLCAEFSLPYATVEASRTNQGDNDEWRPWREIVTAAVRQAAVNFWLTPTDRAYLASILPDETSMARLNPFVDQASLQALPQHPLPGSLDANVPTILSVAMMRPGAKARSYALLANALRQIDQNQTDMPFNLVVAGDGPARADVEAALSFLPANRVHFAGALAHDAAIGLMKSADLLVWPGYREAIGMVYLEAQAVGLPVVALDTAGTPEAIVDGQTGLLAKAGRDLASEGGKALALAISGLLSEPKRARAMGNAGSAMIAHSRDIGTASATLAARLDPLIS